MQRIPQVTVVVPTFNHGHFLPYALKSVLAQNFLDWEAIVVDDGSTDNTREVVGRFTDTRIHYVFQENRGLAAARNTGIRAARGEYLAFLDADDEWEPHFLTGCVDELVARTTIAAIVTTNCFIDENGRMLPRLGATMNPTLTIRAQLLMGGFFPVHAVLVKAEIVRRVGLFDEALSSREDWDLWLRITAEGEKFGYLPQPLARYRVYPGSMSTSPSRMHSNRITVLTKFFGPPSGYLPLWPRDKRSAYGYAYRAAAFAYILNGQPDRGWYFLGKAMSTWPSLVRRVDTFYELLCGSQPPGNRGHAATLNIEGSRSELLQRLGALFQSAPSYVQKLRGVAFGNAHLALAMLTEQAAMWGPARKHLLRALQFNPSLVRNRSVVRRLVKLLAGRRTVGLMQRLARRSERWTLD